MGDRIGFLLLSVLVISKFLQNKKNSYGYRLKSQTNRKNSIQNEAKKSIGPGSNQGPRDLKCNALPLRYHCATETLNSNVSKIYFIYLFRSF